MARASLKKEKLRPKDCGSGGPYGKQKKPCLEIQHCFFLHRPRLAPPPPGPYRRRRPRPRRERWEKHYYRFRQHSWLFRKYFFEVKCFCLVRQSSNFFFREKTRLEFASTIKEGFWFFPYGLLFFRKRGCWTLAHLISSWPLFFLSPFIAGRGPNREPNVRSLPLNPLGLKKSPLSTHAPQLRPGTLEKNLEKLLGLSLLAKKSGIFFFVTQ